MRLPDNMTLDGVDPPKPTEHHKDGDVVKSLVKQIDKLSPLGGAKQQTEGESDGSSDKD